jgi:hypothetical protein
VAVAEVHPLTICCRVFNEALRDGPLSHSYVSVLALMYQQCQVKSEYVLGLLGSTGPAPQALSVIALLVQKYKYCHLSHS